MVKPLARQPNSYLLGVNMRGCDLAMTWLALYHSFDSCRTWPSFAHTMGLTFFPHLPFFYNACERLA